MERLLHIIGEREKRRKQNYSRDLVLIDISRTFWTCTQETVCLAPGDATWVSVTGERHSWMFDFSCFFRKAMCYSCK